MGWDEPSIEVNALIPAQLAARPSKKQADKVEESELVDFEIVGTNLSGADPLHLILVRRDPRFHFLPARGELVMGGLGQADIIPLLNVKPESSKKVKAQAMIRERSPGAYDLIAFRSPRIDNDNVATNETNVLRSALVLLEPPPRT